jgi:hypothetical protein
MQQKDRKVTNLAAVAAADAQMPYCRCVGAANHVDGGGCHVLLLLLLLVLMPFP